MEYRSVHESLPDPKRRNYLQGFVYLLSGVIVSRLWYLQVLKGEDFSFAALKNRIREMPKQAQRGIIYDRDRVFKISAEGISYEDKIYKNIYEDYDIIDKKHYCELEPKDGVFIKLIKFDNNEESSFFARIVKLVIEKILN